MKLLNILGAVVVVHIAVLILAVAIPGCRTTSGASNSSVVAVDPTLMSPSTASSSPISSVPDLSDSDLNPPLADASSPTFDPNAPARSAASSSGRYSPTRPNSPVGSALTPAFLPESAPPVTPVTTYTVKGGDNLWTLAKKNNVSVRELASANDLAADSGLRVGQVLVIPGAVRPASPTAAPAVDPAKVITYTIQPGDTLAKIARGQGTTVAKIKAFNNLTSDFVRAGDRLSIPESDATEVGERSPSTATTASATTSPTAAKPAKGAFQHVVAAGESLTLIAQKYGVKIGDIALANNIRNPALIRPGQSLTIPGWEAPIQTAPRNSTPAVARGPITPVDDEEDLDAGLDDTNLDNVPVIQVEEPPITTLSTEDEEKKGPAIFE